MVKEGGKKKKQQVQSNSNRSMKGFRIAGTPTKGLSPPGGREVYRSPGENPRHNYRNSTPLWRGGTALSYIGTGGDEGGFLFKAI